MTRSWQWLLKLGIKLRLIVKRFGMFGVLDPLLARIAGVADAVGARVMSPPSDERTVLVAGGTITLPPGFVSFRQLATGLYEKDVTDLIKRLLGDGMTMVDLGANVGYYSLLASRIVGRSGNVYAFEPDPQIYSYLQRNLEANGCHNVTSVQKAASDSVALARFVRSEFERGFVSSESPTPSMLIVETVTLDSFFAQIGWPPVDLIKMDIEGSEHSALHGMKLLSARNPKLQLIMESNFDAMRRAHVTPEEITATLRELGFRKAHVIEQRLRPVTLVKPLPASRILYNLLLVK